MLKDTKKIIITIVLILGMLIFITACDSDDGDDDNELSISKDTPGYQTLGCGTNVLGEYAVEGNVLGQVLDIDALNKDEWLILNNNVQETHIENLSGSKISEYAKNLGYSVGLKGRYLWFSASIKAAFKKNTYRKFGYYYTTLMEQHYINSLKIQNYMWNNAQLNKYITEEAAEAINDDALPPKNIFETFGTHVMVGIYTGGRLDYNLAIKTSENETDIGKYVNAKAKAATYSKSITAEITTESEFYKDFKKEDEEETIQAKGGESEHARPDNEDEYLAWVGSISDKPCIVGFIENALIPIWTFADGWDHLNGVCTEGTRCAEIKAEFEHIGGQIDDEFEIKNEAEITQYMDKDKWEAEIKNMEMNYKTLTFPTTIEQMVLANELPEINPNREMGSMLTFEKDHTGFPFDFILEAPQALQYGLVYMDLGFDVFPPNNRTSEENWEYSVSIGRVDEEEDDDFSIQIENQDSGRSVFAIGLWFCHNMVEGDEKFIVRCLNGYKEKFDNVPNNDNICTFVGFVSSSPIKELFFDEDDGGDDIFIKFPYFGVSDQTD